MHYEYPLNVQNGCKARKVCSYKMVSNVFGTRDQFYGRQFFSWTTRWGNVIGMIQGHYIYCAFYFYYYYISSTSDHQALDPGGWGSLFLQASAERLFGIRHACFLSLLQIP